MVDKTSDDDRGQTEGNVFKNDKTESTPVLPPVSGGKSSTIPPHWNETPVDRQDRIIQLRERVKQQKAAEAKPETPDERKERIVQLRKDIKQRKEAKEEILGNLPEGGFEALAKERVREKQAALKKASFKVEVSEQQTTNIEKIKSRLKESYPTSPEHEKREAERSAELKAQSETPSKTVTSPTADVLKKGMERER